MSTDVDNLKMLMPPPSTPIVDEVDDNEKNEETSSTPWLIENTPTNQIIEHEEAHLLVNKAK